MPKTIDAIKAATCPILSGEEAPSTPRIPIAADAIDDRRRGATFDPDDIESLRALCSSGAVVSVSERAGRGGARMPSDETLACRAAKGDRPAFAALLERHYDFIYCTAAHILGNRHDAEDAAQEVCAGLAKGIASWHGKSFRAWLYRVAVNRARDARRRGAARARAEGEYSRQPAHEVCGGGEAETRVYVKQVLDALPEQRRDVVWLVYGKGFTHAEAADALGMAEGTVSWHISEIRAHLRALAKTEGKSKEAAR